MVVNSQIFDCAVALDRGQRRLADIRRGYYAGTRQVRATTS